MIHHIATALLLLVVMTSHLRPVTSLTPPPPPRGPLAQMFRSSLRSHPDRSGADPGLPVFVSEYLRAGRPDLARQKSLAGPLSGTNITSYSGLITVNEKFNSNMYFWFVPAVKADPSKVPICLWLQGGPGGPSVYGLLVENGPFGIDEKLQLYERNVSWTDNYNMLYIDNPVGTGFSFTNSDEGYATSEDDVARDLYSALSQFFQIFTSFRNNDFYITGESYAGKYIPSISYKIHVMNKNVSKDNVINMKGMAIGDGWCDPINMIDYGNILYNIGFIDENQNQTFSVYTTYIKKLIEQNLMVSAFYESDRVMGGDLYPYGSYYYNVTGSKNYFNLLYTTMPVDTSYWSPWVQQNVVRQALHVGSLTFHVDNKVEEKLIADNMKSEAHHIAQLLDSGYKMMFYNGNLDIIVGVPLTENFLWKLQWSGNAEYRAAPRYWWKVKEGDTEVAGFVRRARNMSQVVIRNSGHLVPYDQPVRALDMMVRFTSDAPYPWI